MQQVLISLSSFGATEVRRHGQLWFTQLAQAAGADGVEVRGELLTDARAELPAIGAALR
ncbi:MAG TPA: glutamine ABC transporter ATP-binding protein, partial [Ramlibacter sp.]|nr:glutamine ABC transporter ATP-binding protein [Ramlibacter sp.]